MVRGGDIEEEVRLGAVGRHVFILHPQTEGGRTRRLEGVGHVRFGGIALELAARAGSVGFLDLVLHGEVLAKIRRNIADFEGELLVDALRRRGLHRVAARVDGGETVHRDGVHLGRGILHLDGERVARLEVGIDLRGVERLLRAEYHVELDVVSAALAAIEKRYVAFGGVWAGVGDLHAHGACAVGEHASGDKVGHRRVGNGEERPKGLAVYLGKRHVHRHLKPVGLGEVLGERRRRREGGSAVRADVSHGHGGLRYRNGRRRRRGSSP